MPDEADSETTAQHLAIVIPAFNEQDTVAQVIESLPARIDGVTKRTVIVVDDGSSDETCARALAAGAKVVSHHRNLGLAEAFRTAVRLCLEARATIAVSMDADLQFSPDDIPALVGPILSNKADFVAGDRFAAGPRPRHMSRVKYYGNQLMTWAVNRITGGSFTDVSSGYRAYSREALLNLNVQSSFTYTQETFIELAAKGLRIAQVPVSVRYYPERRSYISGRIVRYGLRTFLTIARTTRDYAPLTVFGAGALIAILPGSVLGIFTLGHYVLTGSFSPYIFIALSAAYLVTAGIALLVLGLLADMFRAIRSNQERLLYFAKRREYTTDMESSDI